ncbi:MAG: hypothetical protein U0T84_09915 [Chitinophagales bacterium]
MAWSVFHVGNSTTEKEFLEYPFTLYQHDKNWIAPLVEDIQKVFDRKKNHFFTHGDASRWILKDERGHVVGRIAAFVNERSAFSERQPTGGCGFFECINDQGAAFLLFDKARLWLEEKGMKAMDGPINFGERNAWWGLLTQGFDQPPTYQMNYNPPYYQQLFESYGFKNYFEQYSYGLPIQAERPEKYQRFYERLLQQGYHFEHAQKSNLEKYAVDFRTVYNQAWVKHHNFKPMTREQSLQLLKTMKPVMVDYLMWYAYYQGEPVAMFIMLPELNQWFKHVHGRFTWWGKLKFLWHQHFGYNDRIFGIVFGVIPAHQRKGVEAGIVMAAHAVVSPKKRWKWIELTWIGDFNPRMMRTCETVGGTIVKTHITFRKLFDEHAPFERHPVID